MDATVVIIVLIINVLISVWNCYAVGTAWKDTMAVGGWFNKLVLWSAVIQSGVGFSMPLLLGLSYGSVAVLSRLTSEGEPIMTAAQGGEMIQFMFSLWYIAVIVPILGTGLSIWAHSLRVAYQRRDFASFATAGWNTFAQINNTVSAVRNIGGAWSSVSEGFGKIFSGKGDARGKILILLVFLVILSLVGGFFIAFTLVRRFAASTQSRLEEYGEHLAENKSWGKRTPARA